MKHLIITLDGGGVRGVITLRILDRLQEMLGVDLTLHTHLWAGTSVGGISALAIAKGWPIHRLLELTEEALPKIFKDSWKDDIRDLGRLRGAEYGLKGLKDFADDLFGDTILGELESKVVVPTIRLFDGQVHPGRWRMKVYHNIPGEGDEEISAAWLAVSTAAAPTYFPIHHGHVDGGLVANNPCLVGVGTAVDARGEGAISFEDCYVLSIGTGVCPRFIKTQAGSKDWGAWAWKDRIIPLILDAQVDKDAFLAYQLMQDRFHRIQPTLRENWGLDAHGSIHEMLLAAERVNLDEAAEWLKKVLT